MAEPRAIAELARAVASSGLISERSSGVVMVSGGADSACAAAGIRELLGGTSVTAIHINYGLRASAAGDERSARELCGLLRIDLHVERPELGSGNLQAAAREARYKLAESLRERTGGDWVATGHTRTDLAETVLYRLAASPGSRALLGMPERRGAIVRPLLAVGRAETRRLAVEAKLPFSDDPTNAEPAYARNRVRNEVLAVLAEINPQAERNIALTRAELAEESAALDEVVAGILERLGVDQATPVLAYSAIADLGPALQRLLLRRCASLALGRRLSINRARAGEVVRLASVPTGGEIELGEGVKAICEHGMIRFSGTDDGSAPEPAVLTVPGRAEFGSWRLEAAIADSETPPSGPEVATLDADSLGSVLEVRSWRAGDRIRPLGLGGSRSLQDLFTDRKIPRSLRTSLPVVAAGDRIAWIAGVAVSDEFRLGPSTRRVAILRALRGA